MTGKSSLELFVVGSTEGILIGSVTHHLLPLGHNFYIILSSLQILGLTCLPVSMANLCALILNLAIADKWSRFGQYKSNIYVSIQYSV